MMTFTLASTLAAFGHGFGLTAALIAAIGAQNTFVLRQGLRREHVGPIVAFCALADVTLVAAGVAGLGTALRHVPELARALTLGGVAFLLAYALLALRRALHTETMRATGGDTRTTLPAALAQCAAFTFLNPHVYLDTLLLMGTVGAAEPLAAQPVFVAGAGIASLTWFTALGFGARLLAPLFARPLAWRILDSVVAAMMLALALGLLCRVFSGLGD